VDEGSADVVDTIDPSVNAAAADSADIVDTREPSVIAVHRRMSPHDVSVMAGTASSSGPTIPAGSDTLDAAADTATASWRDRGVISRSKTSPQSRGFVHVATPVRVL
jgi:hypothetical protein